MRKKQWYKNTTAVLALFLIINVYGTLVIAENQPITDNSSNSLNNMNPFHYGLFSGDENKDLLLQGQDWYVFGDIHTNAGLVLKAGRFELCGLCETVKGYNLDAAGNVVLLTPTPTGPSHVTPNPSATSDPSDLPSIKSSKFVNNQSVIEMPNIEYPLREDAFLRNKLIDINPKNYKSKTIADYQYSNSTFTIFSPFVVQDGTTYYFDGNLTISNSVKFIGNGVIIATRDIKIYGPSFDTTDGAAFIYSMYRGIECAPASSNSIKAIFYAPEGDLIFQGQSLNITGKLIGRELRSMPSRTIIKSDYLGFEEILNSVFKTPTPSPTSIQTPTPTNIAKRIDVNGDRVINLSDIMILAAAFNSSRGDVRYVEAYDLNSDGAINLRDIMIIAAKFNTMV